LGLDLGQVSRALTSLAARGYVVRKNERGRQISVFLTPQGMKLYRDFVRVSQERNRALVEGLSDDDVRQFVQTLDIILTRARVLTGTRNLID
jgi:DNA-binding MarR family transcriptional regulator